MRGQWTIQRGGSNPWTKANNNNNNCHHQLMINRKQKGGQTIKYLKGLPVVVGEKLVSKFLLLIEKTVQLTSICKSSYVNLKMFFSFQFTNKWLNTIFFQKEKKQRKSPKTFKRQYVYSTILWHTVYCCIVQRLVTSDGSDGTQNDPGHPDNEWGWLSRRLGGPQGLK